MRVEKKHFDVPQPRSEHQYIFSFGLRNRYKNSISKISFSLNLKQTSYDLDGWINVNL